MIDNFFELTNWDPNDCRKVTDMFSFGLQQFLEKYYECPHALELKTAPQTKEGKEYLGNIDIAAAAKDYLLRAGAQQAVVETIHCAENTYVLSASWVKSGVLQTYYELCFDY
jgi:hypothetical protein